MANVPPLPARLSLGAIERATWPVRVASAAPSDGVLSGTRVAGRRAVEGSAYVVSHPQAEQGAPLAGFRDGDILVTPMVHPAWLADVLRSGGVVAETGGWLSHMAIVARERDVAMIVGVAGLARIAHGARLRLTTGGRVEMAGSPCMPGQGEALAAEWDLPFAPCLMNAWPGRGPLCKAAFAGWGMALSCLQDRVPSVISTARA